MSILKLDVFNETVNYLPQNIKKILYLLPNKVKNDVTEIRLRSGRPLALTLMGQNVFVSKLGQVCHLMQNGLYLVTQDEVEHTFKNMCEFSFYAHKEQLKNGFIPLKFGCRAGVAATAVFENGVVSGFSSISSINIRIAAEYKGVADPLTNYIDGGLIIGGPPSSGKTTMLRDVIRHISYGIGTERKRITVVDTRDEICATCDGVPTNDIGPLTDVLTNCEKHIGIELALRTLNPQVIAFDEIGNEREAEAVKIGFNAGVDLITTVHIGSVDEIKSRTIVSKLLCSGVIRNFCLLKGIGQEPLLYKVLLNSGDFKLVPKVKENA